MKVGIFYSGLNPEAGGGYTFESDILEGFINIIGESPHHYTLLCFPKAVTAMRKRYGDTIHVHRIKATWIQRKIVSVLHTSDSLRSRLNIRSWMDRAADEAKVDLLWILGKGPCLTDRPYIAVVWDVQHRVTPWFPELNSRTWDWREQTHHWYLGRASAVIAGTKRGRDELMRFYQLPRERITILPHPTPKFALEASKEDHSDILERFNITRPYLFYPAQFWPHKNHVNLILGLDHLRSVHGISLDLVLVGTEKGNLGHVKKLMADRNLTNVVHLLGFVSRSDLIAFYRKAFALVYASWCGPENLPPLEAFALGCPVIATRIPGAEEQFGDAVLFAEPHDPADIANKIYQLYSDPGLRTKLVDAGHKRASSWTAEDYVRGVFSLLDDFEPIGRCWFSNRL